MSHSFESVCPSWALVLPSLLLAACGGSVGADSTSQYVDDAGTFADGPTSGGTTGLPCDVASALSGCRSCHSNPPTTGTPMALVSYDDLVASSSADPTQTNAQRAVARMKDTASPMPPKPASPASAADIATLESWIAAGMPKGDCAGADAGNPYDVPPTCTSGRSWTGGDRGSSSMHPGGACISCHQTTGGEGPIYALAGTVYPTAHEPDDCFSVISGGAATVVVTDASGKVININVNSVGNFAYRGFVAKPYTAKVVYQGRERVMATPQNDGDCNKCHTQTGASSAPGRIILP